MTKVGRALISVHDKTGVVDFARGLVALGAEIISTGGTARLLRESGIAVVDVAEVTGFPEMLDGRVKTLHPKVHGGLLARRELPEHVAALERHGIRPIDLVAVTLYPFEQTVARAGVTLEEAIENIDIGGPSMIRGAAKNHAHVAVLTDPAQYGPVLDELRKSDGTLSDETRFRLAADAFRRTAQYDAAIATYLRDPSAAGRSAAAGFPERLAIDGVRVQSLRYGENPHQAAAFYRPAKGPLGLSAATQLHGPELSYNNLLDWSAALGLLLEFDDPAAVVIKHTNPCGVALGAGAGEAIRRAKACDPVSIYGGIVGLNRTVDLEVVKELSGILLEILFAPAYEPDALEEIRAERGGAVRPALRVAGGQARQVQRHRARHRGAGGGRRSRADEPGGLGPARGDARARGGARDEGLGVRLRRVLPVPRRARRGRQGRRHRGDPSGGLAPRRGSRGRGRPARHGHGGVRDPPFQALVILPSGCSRCAS